MSQFVQNSLTAAFQLGKTDQHWCYHRTGHYSTGDLIEVTTDGKVVNSLIACFGSVQNEGS